MSKQETYTCMICRKNKVTCSVASDGSGAGETGFGPNRPVCKEQECRDKMREQMKEHYQRQAEAAAREILEKIQGIMDRKEKLTIDFEQYALTEQQKEICRKYVKADQEIEDIKKQQEQLEKETEQKKKDALKCNKCHRIPASGEYYRVDGEGNYCKSCAEIVANDSNSNKGYNEHQVNRPSTGVENPCDECHLKFSTYYTIGGKGHYCNDCCDKVLKKRSGDSSSSPNTSSGSNSPSIQTPRPKILLIVGTKKEVMDYAKEWIRKGTLVEDIDTSSLSPSEIDELRDFEQDRTQSNRDINMEFKPSLSSRLKPFLVGGLIFFGLLILVVSFRKKNSRRIKKKK